MKNNLRTRIDRLERAGLDSDESVFVIDPNFYGTADRLAELGYCSEPRVLGPGEWYGDIEWKTMERHEP